MKKKISTIAVLVILALFVITGTALAADTNSYQTLTDMGFNSHTCSINNGFYVTINGIKFAMNPSSIPVDAVATLNASFAMNPTMLPTEVENASTLSHGMNPTMLPDQFLAYLGVLHC